MQAKVEKLMRMKMATGKRITVELKSMRAYRNPDFLQKMVDFFGIDHTGTCYSPDVWDPKRLPPEDFYDRCGCSKLLACSPFPPCAMHKSSVQLCPSPHLNRGI